MLKKRFLNLNTLITFAILGIVIISQSPIWLNNLKKESTFIPITSHNTMDSKNIVFPSQKRSLIIFWSTTCAPCKVEMWRIKNAIENGDFAKEQVFAINTYENHQTIRKFLEKSPYPFNFISNENITKTLNIHATPTIALLESNKVIHLSTGLNLIGLWYAQFFLNDQI